VADPEGGDEGLHHPPAYSNFLPVKNNSLACSSRSDFGLKIHRKAFGDPALPKATRGAYSAPQTS